MVCLDSELWSSARELFETPARAPPRCAQAVIILRCRASPCPGSFPSPTPLFCSHESEEEIFPFTFAKGFSAGFERPRSDKQDALKVSSVRKGWNRGVYGEGHGDPMEVADSQQSGSPFPRSKEVLLQDEDEDEDAEGTQDSASNAAQKISLRVDALDLQRDFRGRQRPLLDVDTPLVACRSKPGKRQNVPPKARKMILTLRSLPVEEFALALTKFKYINPDRADWLYVLRYFKEKEDKSMLLEVFKFVLVLPAFKASARDYTNLIQVFVQLQNPEAVESILKLMVEREIFPDLMTFTVVIGMYGNLGNLDMVNAKVEEMKQYQLEPDTITYCAIIEAYCKMGYAAEAELFMEKMELENLPLKNQIFISLIKGYGNSGRAKEAERVFQLMQGKLLYPDRISYSALMDAYSKDDDALHAIEVFNNMVAVGIEPTDMALARLLRLCEKKNMLPEALEIMEKLESKKFKYGTNMLISLRGWLAKLEFDREVEQMSSEVEKRLERKAYAARKWSTKAYLPASYCL